MQYLEISTYNILLNKLKKNIKYFKNKNKVIT